MLFLYNYLKTRRESRKMKAFGNSVGGGLTPIPNEEGALFHVIF